MITFEEAREIATRQLTQYAQAGYECTIIDQGTIEKPYGWCFFYQSRAYLETGDFHDALVGNSPILVERETGRIVLLGTAFQATRMLEVYEKGFFDPHDLTVIKLRLWHESLRMLSKLGIVLGPDIIAQEGSYDKALEYILDHALPYTFKSQKFLYTYEWFDEIDQSRCFTYRLTRSDAAPG